MTRVEEFTYIDILKNEFEKRNSLNNSYSLRAFSRDLDISPSRLSRILNNKQGLSREFAEKIAGKLDFSNEESSYFCDLVENRHARSKGKRELAGIRLKRYEKLEKQQISLDAFRVISDWYHYAILELTTLKDFNSSHTWIAKALNINKKLVDSAIERLMRLELLEKIDNAYVARENFNFTPTDIPSDSIRKFHRQILEKAISALSFQSVSERDFSSMILGFDNEKDMQKAKAEIKAFRRKFMEEFEKIAEKKSIYNLSIQFFRLDERNKAFASEVQNVTTH